MWSLCGTFFIGPLGDSLIDLIEIQQPPCFAIQRHFENILHFKVHGKLAWPQNLGPVEILTFQM